MKWIKKVWLQFVAGMQEFRRDIKESSELVDLRKKSKEYYQMMCLLQDQVMILQRMRNLNDTFKKQDEVLLKMNEYLQKLSSDVNLKPGSYQTDRVRAAVHEGYGSGSIVKKMMDDTMQVGKDNFIFAQTVKDIVEDSNEKDNEEMKTIVRDAFNLTTSADEVRPKLVYNVEAAKVSINELLSGVEIESTEAANNLLSSLSLTFLGDQNTITNKVITQEQRYHVRKYIKDMIQQRARFIGPWIISIGPDDMHVNINPDAVEEVILIDQKANALAHERESPCQQCETGEYKLMGVDPGGNQRYECTECGDKISFP